MMCTGIMVLASRYFFGFAKVVVFYISDIISGRPIVSGEQLAYKIRYVT
jgi:hypothetical protein